MLFQWAHISIFAFTPHGRPLVHFHRHKTQLLSHWRFGSNLQRGSCKHIEKQRTFVLHLQSSSAGSTQNRKEVEVWLDLRGTALFPREAIQYLNEEMEDSPCIIDKAILPSETAEKVVLQQGNNDNADEMTCLYVPAKSRDDIFLSCQDSKQSLPCGKIIRQESGTMFNPVLALDIVMRNGGWVLMDSEDENTIDEKVWIEEISSLMTFLLSSSPDTAGLDLNGGLELSDSSDSNPLLYTTPAGNGIAVACPTGNILMEVSKTLMSITSLPGGSSTSPGGILLPRTTQKDEEDDLSSIIIPDGSNNNSNDSRVPVALVLPVDVKLWKTAMDLLPGYAGSDTPEF